MGSFLPSLGLGDLHRTAPSGTESRRPGPVAGRLAQLLLGKDVNRARGEKTQQCRPGEKKEADALCFQEVFLFLSLSLLMCLTDQMTAEIKVLVLHLISLW